ncbi:hypothetical protein NL676_039778 [Syzygium grande]|nr:hypothetical protein NL676_039778 [Syzygium grande]
MRDWGCQAHVEIGKLDNACPPICGQECNWVVLVMQFGKPSDVQTDHVEPRVAGLANVVELRAARREPVGCNGPVGCDGMRVGDHGLNAVVVEGYSVYVVGVFFDLMVDDRYLVQRHGVKK